MKTRKARRCTALLSLALILCLLLGTTALAAENPFHDVNSSDYFYEPVLWAVENSVTAGVTPTRFAPNAPCTRGQTVAFLWRALGKPTPQKTENPFTDVAASAYYYTPVLWAVEKGVTYGISATQFGPEATVTRSQVVTFLWRAAGSPAAATSTNPFTDVRASEYYYKAVLWAAEKGITAGVTPTSFAPNAPCTRAQIVSFLHRYITKVVSPAPLPLTIVQQPQSSTVAPGEIFHSMHISISGGKAPYVYRAEGFDTGSNTWIDVATSEPTTQTSWDPGLTARDKPGSANYHIIVTDANGDRVISEEVTLSVSGGPLHITAHPSNATVQPGEMLTTLNIQVSGGVPNYYYYQAEMYVEGTGWKLLGEHESVYTQWKFNGNAPTTAGTYRYRISVTDSSGTKVTSNEAIITVKSDLRITAHPTGATVAPNSKLTTLNISIVGGSEPYHYAKEQYYEGRGWIIIAELRDATFTTWNSGGAASSKPGTYRYRLTATDASGTKVTSNEATITVKSDLRITAHPTNATVSPGNYLNTLKITVAGGVAPYFYRVEEYKNDMWSGIHGQQNVTDTTWTTTLHAPMAEGTYRYRITVQDDSGTIVTSNAAVITVKSRLRITAHPTGATVAPNSKLTTLNISIADGIKPYHYVKEQYYEGRGWIIIAELRDATFTTWNSGGAASSKPGTYRYRLTVTDASGGKVISNEAIITVKGN